MDYINYNPEQYLFDRCLNGIFIAIKLLFKTIIYFPLLLTGYLIASTILSRQDNGIIWSGVIVIFACVLYLFIFFLKGIFIAFKSKGNMFWIPLFVVCVAYTCIAPVCIGFETIEKVMLCFNNEQGAALTWLFCFVYGYYVYTRYQFLTNVAPAIAAPAYQTGIDFGLYLNRIF